MTAIGFNIFTAASKVVKRKETKVGQKAADDIFKVLKIKTIMQEFYNEGEIKTFLNKR